jgi:hypothetical protein
MQFDIDSMAATDRYELLLGTVVPRPIALVTTISSDGMINAAPFSAYGGTFRTSRINLAMSVHKADSTVARSDLRR